MTTPEPGFRPAGLTNKDFRLGSKTYAPMDMETQSLTMTFDVAARTAVGVSTIAFHQNVTSRPTFLLDNTIRSVKLNGEDVAYSRIQDPDRQNTLVAVDREIPQGQAATLEVTYALGADRVSFSSGGVGFITDMADTIGRFLDKWAPANFEDDQFALTMRLIVKNGSSKHQVFGNGEIQQVSDSEWVVKYPAFFTSTSMFVHLTNRTLYVNKFNVQGMERQIPITVYSYNPDYTAQASAKYQALFNEIEAQYGPYLHPSYVAYVTDVNGGMEYVGGTITALRAVSHELFHSWFARGEMPADGRSGWLDEAIASWRDHGYERATSLLSRGITNLANFSEYARKTPKNSYGDGRAVLGEFDRLFADRGGMKPILRDFFSTYKGKLMTTQEFRNFLEQKTGTDLSAYFTRYVYGGESAQTDNPPDIDQQPDQRADSEHPPALTQDELERIR